MASEAFALVAGEASGDMLAAPTLRELRQRRPEASFVGVGGDRMIAEGLDAWAHVRELSVRGYVEVLRHLPRLWRLRTELFRRIDRLRPAAFIGVDAPDFNLGLAHQLRAKGIRTVQFVAPAVWAWRPERMQKVRQAIDLSLLIFPFEKPLFDQAGVRSVYVGHPLADIIPMQSDALLARQRLGVADGSPMIAVLPGSRPDEIRHLAPVFAQAMQRIARSEPHAHFLWPAADDAIRRRLSALAEVQQLGDRVQVMRGRSHDCLEACDVALAASGTATLEAALFKRPMVISYRMPSLTAWLIRRKGRIPYVGLPNILAGAPVVPEILQDQATAEALSRAVLDLLHDSARRQQIVERFSELHDVLKRDTARLAADAILELVR